VSFTLYIRLKSNRANGAAVFLELLRAHIGETISLLGIQAWFLIVHTGRIGFIRSLTILGTTIIRHFFHVWLNVGIRARTESRAHFAVQIALGYYSVSLLSAYIILSPGISLTILRDGHHPI
jgi:hypothetical protein